MQIIIPMAGTGRRFREKGYMLPKPLLNVDGRPIIDYVANLFPGEGNMLFICNEIDLKKTELGKVIRKIRPSAKIVGIPPHKKGPVFTVAQAFAHIQDEEEVIVSYCDFNADWDYSKFRRDVKENKCAGAIPCYTGFHPHLLHRNIPYAGVKVKKCHFLLDIKEKHSFTRDMMKGHHSCGIYYFRRGKDVIKYFKEALDLKLELNGETYVSMVYYLYKRDGLPVYVPLIRHFMQWGTPESFEEFGAWMRYVKGKRGWKKAKTTEPIGRKPDYAVRLDRRSPEFRKTYAYWVEALKSMGALKPMGKG